MAKRVPLACWFLIGCGLIAVVQCGYIASRGWNPTALLQVGPDSPGQARLERELGALKLAPGLGHDGKYSYLMARQPWFWRADADTLESLQDPAYRYGRPLYPLVAGLGGTLPPYATLFGLIVLQIIAGGLLATALVSFARSNGLPTLAVVVGLANPGVYSSAVMLTSDLPALALTLMGLYCWQSGRSKLSIALLAAAILTKEYYALTPLALAFSLAVRRTIALAVVAAPLLPFAIWKLAVRFVLGPALGAANFDWPFAGIVSAAPGWRHDTAIGLFGILLIALSLIGAARASTSTLRWQCAAWGLLGLFASRLVWGQPVDLFRVLAPAWWFVVWTWCSSRRSSANRPEFSATCK